MKKHSCKRYIYCIHNLINDRNYVGQRTWEGDVLNDAYFGSGELLKRAINKYGKDNFEKLILEEGFWTKEELDNKEKYWISYYKEHYNCDYNISPGGTGGDILKDNDELRNKAIEKHKKTMSLKPKEELEEMYKHHSEALKKVWENYSPERLKELAEMRSKAQKEKYKNEPEYRQMRANINKINGPKQSIKENSKDWIESIGKDSHRRQSIHVAKTFYLDTRTNKLYTLKAIALELNIPLTLNIRQQLQKHYPFVIFVENTKENDLLYNFNDNVTPRGTTR